MVASEAGVSWTSCPLKFLVSASWGAVNFTSLAAWVCYHVQRNVLRKHLGSIFGFGRCGSKMSWRLQWRPQTSREPYRTPHVGAAGHNLITHKHRWFWIQDELSVKNLGTEKLLFLTKKNKKQIGWEKYFSMLLPFSNIVLPCKILL